MKNVTKRLLVTAVVLAATLGVSASKARRETDPQGREGQKYYRLGELFKVEGVEVQQKDDQLTAMTARMKNGRQIKLKPQADVSCATSCPAGQHLYCWESEEELMSICVCVSRGGLTGNRIAAP